MTRQGWKWSVTGGQILATRMVTVGGRGVMLDVKSPKVFEMVAFMCKSIDEMTPFTIRRQLKQAGVPKHLLKTLKL